MKPHLTVIQGRPKAEIDADKRALAAERNASATLRAQQHGHPSMYGFDPRPDSEWAQRAGVDLSLVNFESSPAEIERRLRIVR